MKTLIVFTSAYGCTQKISERMKKDLGGDVVLVNLKKEKQPELSSFQRVIIGGSIQSGKMQKRIDNFCQKNLDELRNLELGLFICSLDKGMNANKHLLEAFPDALLMAAKSTAVFKGSFDFDRMNFIERLLVKNVKRVKHNSAKVDFEAVQLFSKRMDRIFNPFLFLA